MNNLIAMLGILALLYVGSSALWRSMKQAVKPTPKDQVLLSYILTIMAGVTACTIIIVAAFLTWKIASAFSP